MSDNDGYCKSCEKLADEIERLQSVLKVNAGWMKQARFEIETISTENKQCGAEIERLRKLVIRAAGFCDYATVDDVLEFGIRCCCGTRDYEPHKANCEFGQEVARSG